jgi:hypothetical protein
LTGIPFGLTFGGMFLQALVSLFFLGSFGHGTIGAKGIPTQIDSLTVYVFLHDECVISQYFTPELTRLFENYSSRKVGFVGYFPGASVTEERMMRFGEKYHLSFTLLEDHQKNWSRKFGVTITPEVAVWDHRTESLLYRGRIDDSYVRVGKRKLHPQHHDLEEVISSWLLMQNPTEMVQTQAIGCFINFTEKQ